MAPVFRILLVDDFAPFRRFIRSALESRPEFRIVDEASDGLEAVRKAKDLQPDLILLDIGLPHLNGIAAAMQIRVFAPRAKILFVSLEASPEIVREAFRLGGHGYIRKVHAYAELIPASEAVLADKQFVSHDLEFSNGANGHRHDVQFYSDDSVFIESAYRLTANALKTDGAAVVIATDSHQKGLMKRLREAAFDVDGAIQRGIYIPLNGSEAVLDIMVNGLLDRRRYVEKLSGAIESSYKAMNDTHRRVALFGEGVGLVYEDGNADGAIEMERICNELIDTFPVDMVCAYPLRAFRFDDRHTVHSICAEHTAVSSE